MVLRRALYKNGTLRSYRPNVPVISIGNITSGGTGKTPITALIATYIRDELGIRPAIVMRGYKRSTKGFLLVSNGRQIYADVNQSGDEAQDYAQKLGGAVIICDEDRVRGVEKAISYGGQVILLDDGFQHLRIVRDCNILLLDRNSNNNVIPFGKNREDTSAARDADIILRMDDASIHIPKKNESTEFRAKKQIQKIELAFGNDLLPADTLKGSRILLVAGIANPTRATRMLEGLGAVVTMHLLPDHAEYSETVIHEIYENAAIAKIDYILTTTKDAVKAGEFYHKFKPPVPVGIIHITYDIESKKIFFEKIRKVINPEQ
jgi:tetraacyldisaccharide 4'-kinase